MYVSMDTYFDVSTSLGRGGGDGVLIKTRQVTPFVAERTFRITITITLSVTLQHRFITITVLLYTYYDYSIK